MKVGIFGGSFDPVHLGHLIFAEYAREAANLDRVIFVPASTSPHKLNGPSATDRQRLEMIKLAISGNSEFEVSSLEIDRDGVSFTVDTLRALRKQMPDAQLFLLMGSDSLESFGRWKQPDVICELATPLIGARHGSSADLVQLSDLVTDARLSEIKAFAFEFPRVEFSSTDLRQRVAEAQSIRYRTPRAVECYIQNSGIYLNRPN